MVREQGSSAPQREIIHEVGPRGKTVLRVTGDELEDGGDIKSASVRTGLL
jgi:hypothetical protein